eukprot:1161288-Pelagomonas_calceolata.AAC.8
MDIGRADRLALQNLQIPERSTNRTLPKYIFPRRFPDKQRLTSSRPDAILVVPMKRVPMTNTRCPLRRRGGRGVNREHSAPATLPASKTPGPRISWRPQSSSTVTFVTIFEGLQLKEVFCTASISYDAEESLSNVSAFVVTNIAQLGRMYNLLQGQ